MKRIALVLGVVFSLSLVCFGQYSSSGRAWRTVSNDDLESFREKRLRAEKDYRENYARMGFPSPEELDRQRDADMVVRLQLSGQLRQARLERERIELEKERLALDAVRLDTERQAADERAAYPETTVLNGYTDYGYGSFGVGGYGYGGYGGFGVPYGGYFPRHRVTPGYRGNRGFGVYGYPTYRVMPYGVIPTGTIPFSGSIYSGSQFFSGGIIGFPGGKK